MTTAWPGPAPAAQAPPRRGARAHFRPACSSCLVRARRVSSSRSRLRSPALGQAARRPLPPRAGPDAAPGRRPAARGLQTAAAAPHTPARRRPQTRGPQRTRPPGHGPPRSVVVTARPERPQCPGSLAAPGPRRPARPRLPRAPGTRRRRIVFEDELRRPAAPTPGRPPGRQVPGPPPVPDYELKYPPVRSERARSRYVAVFLDQHAEFLELRQEVGAARDKLGQLEALLTSLPLPRSQKEAHVAARLWKEMEKKRMDPGFLDKQARCHYLKGKLRHLKSQIRKFDDQADSEGSMYF